MEKNRSPKSSKADLASSSAGEEGGISSIDIQEQSIVNYFHTFSLVQFCKYVFKDNQISEVHMCEVITMINSYFVTIN